MRDFECLNCDCYDSDMGCTMPEGDRSYACTLEDDNDLFGQEIADCEACVIRYDGHCNVTDCTNCKECRGPLIVKDVESLSKEERLKIYQEWLGGCELPESKVHMYRDLVRLRTFLASLNTHPLDVEL